MYKENVKRRNKNKMFEKDVVKKRKDVLRDGGEKEKR